MLPPCLGPWKRQPTGGDRQAGLLPEAGALAGLYKPWVRCAAVCLGTGSRGREWALGSHVAWGHTYPKDKAPNLHWPWLQSSCRYGAGKMRGDR